MDIDECIDLIIEGKTFREIASHYKVSVSAIHKHFSKSEHSARVNEALSISASSYADKADEVLSAITKDSNPVEMSRARELAQHYRWKASKRNPRAFGDKVDITTQGEKIVTPPIQWVSPPDEANQ